MCLFLNFDKPLHLLSFCHDAILIALCFACGISCMIQNLTLTYLPVLVAIHSNTLCISFGYTRRTISLHKLFIRYAYVMNTLLLRSATVMYSFHTFVIRRKIISLERCHNLPTYASVLDNKYIRRRPLCIRFSVTAL